MDTFYTSFHDNVLCKICNNVSVKLQQKSHLKISEITFSFPEFVPARKK